jgi:predicted permease
VQNLKFALRLLVKHRLFSAAVIVTMALAIGVNTSAFSILSALLFRPVPVHNPDRLVKMHMSATQDDGSRLWMPWSYPDYLDYQEGTTSVFSGMTIFKGVRLGVGEADTGKMLGGAAVTRGFFHVIGIRPKVGRTFAPDDKAPKTPVYQAIISKRYWQRHFGGKSDVLGESLTLARHRFTIIGVVDAHRLLAVMPGSTNYWITLGTLSAMGKGCRPLDTRGMYCEQAFARLKPGVDIAAAQQALNIVTDRLARQYPKTNKNTKAIAHGAGTLYGLLGGNRHRLLLISLSLMGVALAILLIACANIVNLFLARAARRVHEVAVRMALGATAPMIARQLLVEAAVLSVIGAAGGLLAGWIGISYVQHVSLFENLHVALDWRVGAFTAGVALAAGLLFSLAPMRPVMKMDLAGRLGVTNSGLSGKRTRVRDALVVVQVALCLGLLVSAGLFIRTLQNAYQTDLGFDPTHVLVARMVFPGASPPPRSELQRIRNRMKRIPGVEAVGFTNMAPLSGSRMFVSGLESAGFTRKHHADAATVVDGYFSTLGVPLLRGRPFSDLPPGNDKVVLVNEAFAQFWPDGWRPGLTIDMGKGGLKVIGVVANVHKNGIRNSFAPRIYYRYPPKHHLGRHYRLNMVARTKDAATRQQAAVTKAAKSFYPSMPAPHVYAMVDRVKYELAGTVQVAAFLLVFALVALLLAVFGIYALLAYLVTQRTPEIGMRQALGATYWDIVGLVARKSALLVAIGIAVGLAAAVLVMRALQHFLYGVTPADPLTLAGAVILFSCIAGIATYIPARRAARLDPVEALQVE